MNPILTASLIVLAGGLTAVNAYAPDQALLDTLVAKGYLTQAEAAAIGSDTSAIVKPKGKAVEKLTISGRLHFQHDYFNVDNSSGDVEDANHFYFRRLRWGAKADLGNGWTGAVNFDFAGDDLSIDKAYVGYKHSDLAKFKFGYFKAPFGLEETTSSSKIKAVERSIANRYFADDADFSGRHAGIGVEGACDCGLSYSFMVANAAQGEGSRLGGESNSNNDLATFGRIQYKTTIDAFKVKVGVDGGYQGNNTNNRGKMTAGTAYAQISTSGFLFQPEIFYGELEFNDGSGEPDTLGFSLLGSYRTGDMEPVIRYSYLKSNHVLDVDELIRRAPRGTLEDGNGDPLDSGDINSVFIGGNYYIKGNDIKLSAGYEWADAQSGSADAEIQGFRTRLQLLF